MNLSRLFSRFALAAVLAVAPLAAGCDGEDATTADDANATASEGKFETFKGADGKYYFHLLAANGEKVLHSQGYTTKANAKKGIESVRTNAVKASSFKVRAAKNGDYYFNVVATNGEIIATSETYDSKSNANRAVETVKNLVILDLSIAAAKTGGAKFTVFTGADEDMYFNLRAANGEIVLQSEGYSSKANALKSIASLREVGTDEASYEIFETSNGQGYFHIKAANGEIIAVSEMYFSLANAQRGLDSVLALITSQKIADAK